MLITNNQLKLKTDWTTKDTKSTKTMLLQRQFRRELSGRKTASKSMKIALDSFVFFVSFVVSFSL
jgi:hypothetical protein